MSVYLCCVYTRACVMRAVYTMSSFLSIVVYTTRGCCSSVHDPQQRRATSSMRDATTNADAADAAADDDADETAFSDGIDSDAPSGV